MTINELFSDIFCVMDKNLKNDLIVNTYERSITRNKFLMRQDEDDKEICFLKSGIVGAYESFPDGKNVYYSICDKPGELIVGGIGSNLLRSPVNIIMLTDVELFCIENSDILRLYENYHELSYFYNKILLEEYQKHWKIKKMLYMDSAEDRYKWFMNNHPETIDIVNHKVIASFLRMSPVTLSRIRTKLGNKEYEIYNTLT